MSEMISFGAGVNSIAMTIMLVAAGWRGPIVFADTGGEWPETYCYMRTFEKQWLKPRGLEITRLSPATHAELYDDKRLGGLTKLKYEQVALLLAVREALDNTNNKEGIATLEEYCLVRGIIPLLAIRWCSVEFKRNPLENWREAHGLERTCPGMSASEPRRIRDDPKVRYPLWEEGITRGECRRIIGEAGLEQPVKSGCFFCPGQRLDNWRRLYYEHRDLYDRAMALEDNASERNQKWHTLDPHGISLREHARRRWEGQMTMDLSQWLPCLCSL